MFRREFLKTAAASLGVTPFIAENEKSTNNVKNQNQILLQLFDKNVIDNEEILFRLKLVHQDKQVIKTNLTMNQQQLLLQEYDKGNISVTMLIDKLFIDANVSRKFKINDEVIVSQYNWKGGKKPTQYFVRGKIVEIEITLSEREKKEEGNWYWIGDKNGDQEMIRGCHGYGNGDDDVIFHWDPVDITIQQMIKGKPVLDSFQFEEEYLQN